jgi:uncharacterized protein (DUF1800 family)
MATVLPDSPNVLPALLGSDDAAISPGEACRFLIQATFGPTMDEIARVQQMGYSAWIDEQMALPVQKHLPVLLADPPDRVPDQANGKMMDKAMAPDPTAGYFNHRRKFVWWKQAVTATDQLRQRVAYAWSQHFVVSDKDDTFTNSTAALCNYYDMLLDNSFGNFRDFLRAVTYSPCMAMYLTYLGNEKADPKGSRRPDENYAREIMQLFTIGLYQFNLDGSPKIVNDQTVPTYNNDDVQEMARVFTGLHFVGHETNWKWGPQDKFKPLQMYPEHHDSGQKVLLGGRKTLPAGQPAEQDIEDALDLLFQHENTPAFVCHFLIERLTTSNPTSDYLYRVTQTFINNGKGVRGDLAAVIRAILLDPEARKAGDDPDSGKLREPYLRLVALGRTFGSKSTESTYKIAYLDSLLGQEPGSSPSVFNFYTPQYSPPGAIGKAGMVGPEFEITTAVTSVSLPNFLRDCIYIGSLGRWNSSIILDFYNEIKMASQPDNLINHLSLLLTGDRMSEQTHDIIRKAVDQIPGDKPEDRVKLAVYLTSICAESAVQP